MSHSLGAKLSRLRHKGYITDIEYQRLKKALEQEPNGDLISRDAALKPYNDLNDEDTISVWLVRENIKELPSVNPQPICEEREKGECPYYAG